MDPRLLRYYNRELQHLREMGEEFGREFPKVAGRLGMEGLECADPYVERLLEGVAFLAARVQLKIDAEFPAFTKHLLEMVCPHYLAPTPSMVIAQFEPDLAVGDLADGYTLPRHTTLLSRLGKSDRTECQYRTAHDVTLWPIEVRQAEYFTHTRDLASLDLGDLGRAKAGVRLTLGSTAGLTFDKLSVDRLQLHLRGSDEVPLHLYESLLAHTIGALALPRDRSAGWHEVLSPRCIGQVGFEDDQALLDFGNRSFQGYRLLQEYFAFPQRFLFVEIADLGGAVRRCQQNELDLIVLFDKPQPPLDNAVDASHFALFCSPAVNLFPKRTDRIHLDDTKASYHVVPDRSRPLDFEVAQVTGVVGYGTSSETEQEFLPFYALNDLTSHQEHGAYFTVQREPRVLSSRQRRDGPRSRYVGSEVFVSIVDKNEAPYATDLRQLALKVLCTNRDLPLAMPIGQGKTDFTLESGAPVKAVRCVAGPTTPIPSRAEGECAWRLVNHLSLNYLSLMDGGDTSGAAALRELLELYGEPNDSAIRKQIDGILSVTARPVVRRLPTPGPLALGRGMEVTLSLDEQSFEGTGVFLIGAVLERFLSKYVSINSFTETVVSTVRRGEVMRWTARTGQRHIL